VAALVYEVFLNFELVTVPERSTGRREFRLSEPISENWHAGFIQRACRAGSMVTSRS
jgi:hypothetical protein